jgi:hypothetical protein
MSSPPWPALVLVEGLPGTGKSTTAQWVAYVTTCRGRRARWVYEQEVPHPILGAERPRLRSWKEHLGRRLAGWARFVDDVRSGDTATIVDSAYLQTSVAVMLRRGLDSDLICTFVARVADIIRPLDPALVYALEPDTDAAFRRICERRGLTWTLQHIAACDASPWARSRGVSGMNGLLAYWREHAAICNAVVERSAFRTLTMEPTTDDWLARRARVRTFLQLPDSLGTATIETDLARYAGRYQREGGRQARLTVDGGSLVIDGLLWLRNRLLPRAPSTFDAESWPFRLTFEDDARGAVTRFRLDGPDLPNTRLAGVYERLA